ncbi:hypothetical protein SUGI_0096060 [Cryptomeria japonica]|nr:hypothetical protein SUGI_0096060 [Cryptomeria japonica]
MEFEEVLDSVILDNRKVIRLDHDYFLPVNLLSEFKLLMTLNFVDLFLDTQKHIHWLIPALLTFTAVVMGFSTTLRLSVGGFIGKVLSRGIQWVCDLLPLPMRRRVYYWRSWVDLLRPSNDLQSKIVRGNISVLITGETDSSSHSVYIEWIFDNAQQKCLLKAGRVASKEVMLNKADDSYIVCCDGDCSRKEIKVFTFDCRKPNESLMAVDIHTASVDIDCSIEEAIKLFIFVAYMAELKSGSLKSYDSISSTVYVRRFVESINAYVRSGYPALHIVELKGVVVR